MINRDLVMLMSLRMNCLCGHQQTARSGLSQARFPGVALVRQSSHRAMSANEIVAVEYEQVLVADRLLKSLPLAPRWCGRIVKGE